MPGRDYFSLIYTLPGFVLLMAIVGLNYYPAVKILDFAISDVFGVLLAFISLFAGSALGFLVTQFWFMRFHYSRLDANRIYKNLESLMKERLGWNPPDNIEAKEKDYTMSAVLDYMLLYDEDEKKWSFCQRKWDIYHTMSGIIVSIITGLIVGLLSRIVFELVTREGWSLGITDPRVISAPDTLLFIFTILTAAIFLFVIWYGRSKIFNEYYKVLEIFISIKGDDLIFIKNLRLVFPTFFPSDAKKHNRTPQTPSSAKTHEPKNYRHNLSQSKTLEGYTALSPNKRHSICNEVTRTPKYKEHFDLH